MEDKINITPILEHILGISKINSEEDLRLLIKVLRDGGNRPLLNSKNMADLMERFKKAKKNTNVDKDK